MGVKFRAAKLPANRFSSCQQLSSNVRLWSFRSRPPSLTCHTLRTPPQSINRSDVLLATQCTSSTPRLDSCLEPKKTGWQRIEAEPSDFGEALRNRIVTLGVRDDFGVGSKMKILMWKRHTIGALIAIVLATPATAYTYLRAEALHKLCQSQQPAEQAMMIFYVRGCTRSDKPQCCSNGLAAADRRKS